MENEMEAIKVTDQQQVDRDTSFDETSPSQAPAWELLEAGRYRPRRIRGSCRGRELG
jgi:hypothetical protein